MTHSTIKYLEDVEDFQTKFGFTMPTTYERLSDELHAFRTAFLNEELDEFIESCNSMDVVTALDSLIDLAYIVAGTVLFHGYSKLEFDEAVKDTQNMLFPYKENSFVVPAILHRSNWQEAVSKVVNAIDMIKSAHERNDELSKHRTLFALSKIWNVCLSTALYMGVPEDLWELLWNDVQRANMAKERAVRNDQSKRGSAAFDVIKPAGWVGPDGARVLRSYFVPT